MKRELLLTLSKAPVIEHNVLGFLVDQETIGSIDLNKLWDDDSAATVYCYDFGCHEVENVSTGETSYIIDKIIICPPNEIGYKFVTRSNLQELFACDYDGDVIICTNTEEVWSGNPDLKPFSVNYNPEGKYYIRNPKLRNMKSYIFNREQFSQLFSSLIASNEEAFERFEDAANGTDDGVVGDFKIWRDEDAEVSILHVPSGVIIGWYKMYHYGRDNWCNRADFTEADLRDFLMLLRHQLMEDPDEPAEDYHPNVKVTETDQSKYDSSVSATSLMDEYIKAMKFSINSIYGLHCDVCHKPINLDESHDIQTKTNIHITICQDCLNKINPIKEDDSDIKDVCQENDDGSFTYIGEGDDDEDDYKE